LRFVEPVFGFGEEAAQAAFDPPEQGRIARRGRLRAGRTAEFDR